MKYLLVVAVALNLVACGGLLSREPLPERVSYLLELPADALAGESEKRCQVLRLSTVSAATGQLGSSMLYKEQAQRIEAFAYSSWVDAPVDMIEPQLRRALNESGLFEAVIAAESPVRPDLSLTISQLSLLHDTNQVPAAVVLEADLELADPAAFELVATGRLAVIEPADTNPAAGAVAANRAVDRFARELLEFLRDSTQGNTGCE